MAKCRMMAKWKKRNKRDNKINRIVSGEKEKVPILGDGVWKM